MTIKEQIKARAEKKYPFEYSFKTPFIVETNKEFRNAYTTSAEDMLPVMEDVALSFADWYHETDFTPPEDMDTDGKLFQHFITNVYKVKE